MWAAVVVMVLVIVMAYIFLSGQIGYRRQG